jgi:spermidine synthase
MRLLVYSCFVLSGVTGLVYEVVWGKYLSLFIGVSAYAHTIVLAAYMGEIGRASCRERV